MDEEEIARLLDEAEARVRAAQIALTTGQAEAAEAAAVLERIRKALAGDGEGA